MGKNKLILALVVCAIIIAGVFLYQNKKVAPQAPQEAPKQEQNTSSDPVIISTSPAGILDKTEVILPNQEIRINFNLPIENIGEFKHEITPVTKYQAKLTDDRKSVVIKADGLFPVGVEFTLIMRPDTKFDGKKTLGREIRAHFKTPEYRGG